MMAIPKRKAGVVGAALTLVVLVAMATPGWGHAGDRVELLFQQLSVRPVGGNDWTVSVKLVDADSGDPAPGFDVVLETVDGVGRPTTLTDQGGGLYSGPLTAAPGKRDIALRAQTQPGGTPGVPVRKVFSVVLEPGKDVAVTGSAPPAEATPPSDVRVRIERSDKVGQTPLWIPIRVTVTEGGGAKPLSVDNLVFAAARNSRGDEAGPFTLGPLEANDPSAKSIHQGFVIVPYGGPWTIEAVAKTAQPDENARTVLGRGTAEMTVDAPVAASAAGAAAVGRKPKSEPLGVAVLWIHTMVAVGWGLAIALLALLALPRGRRFLSEYGVTLLDGHLDKIARGAWWLTGLVVGTGIYNMVKSVAYRVPLSPDQVTRLFRLPYAKPYYLALTVKLAMYAVMIGATIPLIREARRRAAVDEAEVSLPDDNDDHSPWDNPDRPHEDGGRLALRSKRTTTLRDDWSTSPQSDGKARVPVAIMLIGGAVIMAAVTLLKYFHLLGELSRLSG